jgi:hypothetical protein
MAGVATVSPGAADAADAALARASAEQSLTYLREVMDYYHRRFYVYEDVSSAGNHFHAWARFFSGNGTATMNGSWSENALGATSIRCEFQGAALDFAGFALLNGLLEGNDRAPRYNFGTALQAGLNLTGATTLKFKARGERGGEVVTFFMGGVGREEDGTVKRPCTPEFSAPCPAPDSTPALKRRIVLTKEWTEYTIDLTGKNLSYVLGGFGWGASAVDNRTGVTFYLDDIYYELSAERRQQRLNEPRFLRSFTTLPRQPNVFDANKDDDIDLGVRNMANVYDNALALLAFLADGNADSLRRARLLGEAFVYALRHDRTGETIGIRNVYAAGDIALPPGWNPKGYRGTVPAAGFYDENEGFIEIEESRIVDTGNNAWVMLALEALYQKTNDASYLAAARQIGTILRRYRSPAEGCQYLGFRRGIENVDAMSLEDIRKGTKASNENVRQGASAEHNLDLYAAYTTLARLTGEIKWQQEALHARKLVEQMWDGQVGNYWAGTADCNRIYNPTVNPGTFILPVDVQAWTVMAIPGTLVRHPQVLAGAEQKHRTFHHGFSGFDFNNDRDGVWFEGTAHMSVAYLLAQQEEAAAALRRELRTAQQTTSYADAPQVADGYGIPAACHDGLTTGFDPPMPPPPAVPNVFHYHRRLHVGATAWNIFAQLRVNPYYLFKVEAPARTINLRAVSRGALAQQYPYQYGFAQFFIDDSSIYYKTGGGGGGRGFNLAAINPDTGALLAPVQNFDTWGRGCAAMQQMTDYVRQLPTGTILLLAVADEAGINRWDVCERWNAACIEPFLQMLEGLGSRQIRNYCYRDSWTMITIKGKAQARDEQLGKAVEAAAQTTISTKALSGGNQ